MAGFEREMDVVTLASSKSDSSSLGWGSVQDDDDMFNVTVEEQDKEHEGQEGKQFHQEEEMVEQEGELVEQDEETEAEKDEETEAEQDEETEAQQEMRKLKTLLREVGLDSKREIKTSDYQHKGRVVVEVSCRFSCLFVCLLTHLPQTRQEHPGVRETVQTNPGRGQGYGLQAPGGQSQEEVLPSPGQRIVLLE